MALGSRADRLHQAVQRRRTGQRLLPRFRLFRRSGLEDGEHLIAVGLVTSGRGFDEREEALDFAQEGGDGVRHGGGRGGDRELERELVVAHMAAAHGGRFGGGEIRGGELFPVVEPFQACDGLDEALVGCSVVLGCGSDALPTARGRGGGEAGELGLGGREGEELAAVRDRWGRLRGRRAVQVQELLQRLRVVVERVAPVRDRSCYSLVVRFAAPAQAHPHNSTPHPIPESLATGTKFCKGVFSGYHLDSRSLRRSSCSSESMIQHSKRQCQESAIKLHRHASFNRELASLIQFC
jgi:hypothetical protein